MEVTPDPKPAKRIIDRSAISAKMNRERARGCRSCGRQDRRLEAHHLIPRSLGGDDVSPNIVGLCGGPDGCHELFEHSASFRVPVGRKIGRALEPDEEAHVREKSPGVARRYYDLR